MNPKQQTAAAQEKAEEEMLRNHQAGIDRFQRAFAACMESRNYPVKQLVRRRVIRSLIVVAALFLVAGTAASQKVKTIYSGNFDFATHRRYAWGKNHIVTRQGPQNDGLIDAKIVQDVNENLAQKGFIEDPANPDFLISYDAGAGDLSTDIEGGVHAGPAPRPSESIAPVYGIPQNIWYSVDGHITFHVVAADTKQPVWTAAARKTIRDPHKGMKDMEKQVEQFVSKTFKSFPPTSKK